MDKHFTLLQPKGAAFLGLVPDGDLFNAINEGKASVVTDQIDSFTPDGIKLESGDELKADIIVTATGLKLMVCSNIEISVDDQIIDISKTMTCCVKKTCCYRSNVVWMFKHKCLLDIKADLTAEYTCKYLITWIKMATVLPHANASHRSR